MDFETLPSEVKFYFYDKVTYMDIMVHDTIKLYLSSIKSFYIGLGLIYCGSPDLYITLKIINFNIPYFNYYDVY